MSFVTTQPEMVTSGPSMSDKRLLAEGLHDSPLAMPARTAVGRLIGGEVGVPGIHQWTF